MHAADLPPPLLIPTGTSSPGPVAEAGAGTVVPAPAEGSLAFIPEPATLTFLLGAGLFLVALARRRTIFTREP